MRKSILFLTAFANIAMLIAVLAVVKYSVSMTVAFLPVVAVFIMLAVPGEVANTNTAVGTGVEQG